MDLIIFNQQKRPRNWGTSTNLLLLPRARVESETSFPSKSRLV